MAIQFESSIKVTGTIDLNDGNDSTIIGTSAGGGGVYITAVGSNALQNNTGYAACGFGYQALQNNTASYSNGFAYQALQNNTGSGSNGFGTGALRSNTGNSSNGFGNGALALNTGNYSGGFGYNALYSNQGANANGFGYNALQNNTGSGSNGFGRAALYNNTGVESNGFGYGALSGNTGNYSSGFGHEALQQNAGFASSGFGLWALRYNTGDNSNGFGNQTLAANTGNNANAFGALALFWNSGENNTAIGNLAARGDEGFKLTGSNNTFLGANTSYGETNSAVSNSTAVGANVILTDSNTVILGNGASVGIGTTSPNYKLDVDDTIGVGNSLIVNHVPGTFPRVFPPVTPGGFFETEPTGRVGVVNNQDSGEWAFSAVSVTDGVLSNRSGLLHSNANAYRLVLANTTEENIRLNSDGDSFLKGKVAIGHDTPTEDLDVDGVVKVSDGVKTNHISVNGGSRIQLNQAVFYNTGNICNEPYTDIGATLHLRTNEPLADQSVIAITRGGQGTGFPSGITQDTIGDYQFLLRDKDNVQRIRFNTREGGVTLIDNNKIVLSGNTDVNAYGAITINGRKWSDGVSNAVMEFNKTGTQADNALEFRSSGVLKGSITYDGTGTSYNVTSDYRLKENVVEITDGIERLKQLKPSRFNFISNTEKVVDGFIAHEVESVIPEAVTGEKDATEEYEVTPAEYDDYGNLVSEAVMGTRDAYQQIDQAKIVPLLTAALQEAVAKIESLEARIQALESN